MTRGGWFTAATLTLWILLLLPAYWVAGPAGLEGLSYSALLCLIPGWLAFWLAKNSDQPGKQASLAILASSVLRLLFVLFGTLVVQAVRSHLGLREFLVWLIVFYMATLLIETLLVLRTSAGDQDGSRVDGV